MQEIRFEITYANGERESCCLSPGTYLITRTRRSLVIQARQESNPHGELLGELLIEGQDAAYRSMEPDAWPSEGTEVPMPNLIAVTPVKGIRIGDCILTMRLSEQKRNQSELPMRVPSNHCDCSSAEVPSAQPSLELIDQLPVAPPRAMRASSLTSMDTDPHFTKNTHFWELVPGPDDSPATAAAFFREAHTRLLQTGRQLSPHWLPAAAVVGALLLPTTAATLWLSRAPVDSRLWTAVSLLLTGILLVATVQGVLCHYLNAVIAGAPIPLNQARALHCRTLGSWLGAVGLGSILSLLNFPLCLIPGLMLGWGLGPACVLEEHRGLAACKRSAELFVSDIPRVLRALLILTLPLLAVVLLTLAVSAVPLVSPLAPLFCSVALSFYIPFYVLYTLRLYQEIKERSELPQLLDDLA